MCFAFNKCIYVTRQHTTLNTRLPALPTTTTAATSSYCSDHIDDASDAQECLYMLVSESKIQ